MLSHKDLRDGIYLDLRPLIDCGYTFIFVLGGRGIGKTYSLLRGQVERKLSVIYMRRTQVELDISCGKNGNPYKKLNRDFEWNVEVTGGVVRTITKDDMILGYGAALSTFANYRGVDFSDVTHIVFDEFQPGKRKTLDDELRSFKEVYETVDRNREVEGDNPVQVFFVSNSTTLTSPILWGLGLTQICTKMKESGQEFYKDPKRSILIYMPKNLEITEKKRQTALYMLGDADDSYNKFALDNEFVDEDFSKIVKRQMNEYTPTLALDYKGKVIYCYRHKAEERYYFTTTKCDGVTKYTFPADEDLFKMLHLKTFFILYASGAVEFDSFSTKFIFTQIMGD